MRRILIGYDGTERGDDAIALGRALAGAADQAEVTIANVYQALMPKNSHGDPSLREERLNREADALLARLREERPELGDIGFRSVRGTSPSAGLHRLAAELEADAIVVGSSHRKGIGRLWAGSATEQTLQGSPRPVAVAPPGYAAEQRDGVVSRVGVAYDGSEESRHALDLAGDLARELAATVVVIDVVDVVPPPLTGAAGFAGIAEELRELAGRHLEGARDRLAERGVASVETVQLEGFAAEQLIGASRDLGLLVLGSRSHGPALRLLLGSVSAGVVRGAHCPVLLFPRSAAAE